MTMQFEKIKAENRLFEGNSWILPTDMSLIGEAQKELTRRLEQNGWEPNGLEVGFGEALINAMAHGNLGIKSDNKTNIVDLAKEKQAKEPTDKKVFVEMDVTPERVSITVRDEGRGFDWKNLPDPTEPEALLKPFGRGNKMMQIYYDSVARNDAGNEVTIVKKRDLPAEN